MADYVLQGELSLKDSMSGSMGNINKALDQLRKNSFNADEAVKKLGQSTQQYGQQSQNVWQRSVQHAERNSYQWAIFGKLLSVGLVSAAGAVATAIGTLGTVGVQTAVEMENSVGKIQAGLGVTKEKAEELSRVAQSTFVNGWGDSIQTVSQDLVTLRQNMGNIGDDTAGELLDSAYIIRDAFDGQINESTRTASVMMKNFGIEGSEAMDLITKGYQEGGNYSDELLDTLREYSPQFQAMGFSANQMTGILIKGAQAGAFNLDKVGDSIKEFNIRAQDGSKGTAEGFKAIGLDANKMGQDIAAGGERGQKAFMATVAGLSGMKDKVAMDAAGVQLFGR